MKKTLLLLSVIAAFIFTACNRTNFTNIKVVGDDGDTYIAHVIHSQTYTPDTGETVSIIKTDATDGWIYNSNRWTKADAKKYFSGLVYRKVVIGKVVAVIPPTVD